MKKIISFCLSLCIILTCFMVMPVNAADLKKTDITNQGGLLKVTDIIDSVADETEGNRKISRAEFSVMAGKMLGIKEEEEKTRYFTDVPMSHWAVSYINKLTEMKIIALSDDKLFRPNDKITLNEAVKMLISVLGYSQLAENMGGFPVGYSKLAGRLDFKLTGGPDAMTVYQSYVLIYDALRSETYDMNEVKNGNIIYKGSGETFLSKYFDIYEEDGTVMQSSGISVDGKTSEGSTNDETARIVRINSEKYVTDLNFYDYIGRNTHIYYYQKDDNDEKVIVYREDYEKRDNVTDIEAEDFISYENSVLTYRQEKKNKIIKLPIGAFIVKNGEAVRENVADALKIKKGNIRLIDIENDGTVDVVLVWEYKNYFAEIVNSDTFEIYDSVIKQNGVKLDADRRLVFIEDAAGNKKSFSDIEKGTLISVYESKPYVRAVINKNSVSANLYSLSFDNGKHRAQLGKSESDKAWYDIDADFYNNYLKGKSYRDAAGNELYTGDINLPLGMSVTYYLDVDGDIAYITGLNLTEWIYGYLIKIRTDVWEDTAFIKLYTQNDEIKVYQCADKVKIDGIQRKDFAGISEGLKKTEKYRDNEHDINGQVVRFKLNGEGKISAIDTRNFNSDSEDRMSIHYTGSMNNAWIWYHPGSFGNGKYFFSGATIKFFVPELNKLSDASDEDFRLLREFTDTRGYTFDSYRLNPKGANEDVMVVYGSASSEELKGPYLVKQVYEELDANGDVIAKADLYSVESTDLISVIGKDGYRFEFTGADGVTYNADTGDILYVSVDSQGKAKSVVVYNDCSRMKDSDYKLKSGWQNVSGPRQTDTFTDLLSANVKSVDDGVYRFVYGRELEENDLDDGNYANCSWATRGDISVVLVVDGKTIRTGSPGEIVPATYTGVENSPLYWFAVRYARVKGAVVYK